eukprot:9354139-Ditylum_brightwellii.AAC.1
MAGMMPPRIPSDPTGLKLCNTVESQHELGWNNFMKGRIAKKWCEAQALYCQSFPKPKIFDEQQWTTKLIKAILTIFIDVCNARNAHLHTDMENPTTNILDKQVRKVYALQHSMLASDCLLFHLDITDRLKISQESKHLWWESVKIALHNYNAVHKCTSSQRVITEFFPLPQTNQGAIMHQIDNHSYNNTDTTLIPALQ